MANKGSIALDASIMPDTMRIHLRGESFSYLPADATEKWLNHDSFNLKKLETFDTTELD